MDAPLPTKLLYIYVYLHTVLSIFVCIHAFHAPLPTKLLHIYVYLPIWTHHLLPSCYTYMSIYIYVYLYVWVYAFDAQLTTKLKNLQTFARNDSFNRVTHRNADSFIYLTWLIHMWTLQHTATHCNTPRVTHRNVDSFKYLTWLILKKCRLIHILDRNDSFNRVTHRNVSMAWHIEFLCTHRNVFNCVTHRNVSMAPLIRILDMTHSCMIYL